MPTSGGQVTQAVFVFTNMLRKLLADEQPHYLAAVFESGTPTFRHDAYADYKAHRAEMPDELQSQCHAHDDCATASLQLRRTTTRQSPPTRHRPRASACW